LAIEPVEYVVGALAWQKLAGPEGDAAFATVGTILMVVEVAVGPPHPFADTPIVAEPVSPEGIVIVLLVPVPAIADPLSVQL
jgi:hypothetical protein